MWQAVTRAAISRSEGIFFLSEDVDRKRMWSRRPSEYGGKREAAPQLSNDDAEEAVAAAPLGCFFHPRQLLHSDSGSGSGLSRLKREMCNCH